MNPRKSRNVSRTSQACRWVDADHALRSAHSTPDPVRREACEPVAAPPLRAAPPFRRLNGFSLLELVVALAIVAIAAGIAVPGLSSLSGLYRLTSGAQQMVTEVGRTRMRAIGHNAYYRLQVANSIDARTKLSTGIYWLERSEAGSTFALDGVVRSLPRGVRFATLPTAPITFNRQGLSLLPTSLSLADPQGRTRNVSINVAGRVTLQ